MHTSSGATLLMYWYSTSNGADCWAVLELMLPIRTLLLPMKLDEPDDPLPPPPQADKAAAKNRTKENRNDIF
jgi:hypothetical protein